MNSLKRAGVVLAAKMKDEADQRTSSNANMTVRGQCPQLQLNTDWFSSPPCSPDTMSGLPKTAPSLMPSRSPPPAPICVDFDVNNAYSVLDMPAAPKAAAGRKKKKGKKKRKAGKAKAKNASNGAKSRPDSKDRKDKKRDKFVKRKKETRELELLMSRMGLSGEDETLGQGVVAQSSNSASAPMAPTKTLPLLSELPTRAFSFAV